MGRKHFQDFANVLCQQFVETPTNKDLVDLAILGDGILQLRITEGKATHRGHAIEPLPFASAWLEWVEARLEALRIPRSEMRSATLLVDYSVELTRTPTLGWLHCRFVFDCTGVIEALDREYRSELRAEKSWGLGQVSPARSRTQG